MFEAQLTTIACRRTDARAGRSMEMSTAMIPITTNNSTSVNALRFDKIARESSKIMRLSEG
jgi:hypothetical protein